MLSISESLSTQSASAFSRVSVLVCETSATSESNRYDRYLVELAELLELVLVAYERLARVSVRVRPAETTWGRADE